MEPTNQPDRIPDEQPDNQGPIQQEFQHAPVQARVPEHVSPGVFATGAVVLDGPGEFVTDFIQSVIRPPRVVKRIVMIPPVFSQFIEAFRENLRIYERTFGPPKPIVRPQTAPKPPSVQELYDELKLADSELSGVYANAVMITHGPAEFAFDFITRFYPRAAVSARVYISASHAPGLLNTMTGAFGHYLRKTGQLPPQPPQPGQQDQPLPPSEPPPISPKEPDMY